MTVANRIASQFHMPAELEAEVTETKRRISVALGDTTPDLVLKGGQVLDVYRERVFEADIAIAGRRIAAVRPNLDPQGAPVIDCRGLVAGPGFVEPHMHIETTFVTPRQLARAIVPRGTTTLFADGTDGSYVGGSRTVRALFDATKNLPLRFFLEAPSYSAYLPDLQSVGGILDLAASREMLSWNETVSLGEVVLTKVASRDDEYLAKICAYRRGGKRINGHSVDNAPALLDAFVTAGVIDDHTAWSGESIEERLARGMTLFLVEAPGRRFLSKMLEHIVSAHLPIRSLCLCIDNTTISEIAEEGYGYLDYPVSLAVSAGLSPAQAVQMASLNTAAYFGRDADFGSVAPGRFADIQLWDDLTRFQPRMVLFEGQVVAQDGKLIFDVPPAHFDDWYLHTIRLPDTLGVASFLPPAPGPGDHVRARVIHLPTAAAQAGNEERIVELPIRDGRVHPLPDQDILSFCVIERYGKSGRIGYGYLSGSGLKRGALATSISISDSNLLVLGCDPVSMWTAARAVAEMQGGLAAADGGNVCAGQPLPVGGQMSDEPFEQVLAGFTLLRRAAWDLGCTLDNPFLTIASTVLMSIPDLGLTDCGYIDGRRGVGLPTFLD